jgi:hypothetical protein
MEEWRILNSGFEVDRPFFPPFVLVSFLYFNLSGLNGGLDFLRPPLGVTFFLFSNI